MIQHSKMRQSKGNRIAEIIATGFGSGQSPIAPGTVGTIVAIPLFLLIRFLLNSIFLFGIPMWVMYTGVTGLLILTGVWASGRYEAVYRKKDPGSVVIDEIAGYFIAMIGQPVSWPWILAAFFLFRLFDIVKLWPANIVDARMTGGWGIMLDDIIAGIQTMLVLTIIASVFSAIG